jgi:hypothetical protein
MVASISEGYGLKILIGITDLECKKKNRHFRHLVTNLILKVAAGF